MIWKVWIFRHNSVITNFLKFFAIEDYNGLKREIKNSDDEVVALPERGGLEDNRERQAIWV